MMNPRKKQALNFLAVLLALSFAFPGMAVPAASDGQAWAAACTKAGIEEAKSCCKEKKSECVRACAGQDLNEEDMTACDLGCQSARKVCRDTVAH